MTTESPWQNHFAWWPVKIDGLRYWLRTVQRRRVSVSLPESFAAPEVTSFWQYRAIW